MIAQDDLKSLGAVKERYLTSATPLFLFERLVGSGKYSRPQPRHIPLMDSHQIFWSNWSFLTLLVLLLGSLSRYFRADLWSCWQYVNTRPAMLPNLGKARSLSSCPDDLSPQQSSASHVYAMLCKRRLHIMRLHYLKMYINVLISSLDLTLLCVSRSWHFRCWTSREQRNKLFSNDERSDTPHL